MYAKVRIYYRASIYMNFVLSIISFPHIEPVDFADIVETYVQQVSVSIVDRDTHLAG